MATIIDSLAAYVPLIAVAVVFVVYCLVVLVREEVLYLPKWLWAIAICLSLPLGGIVFLIFGRRHEHRGPAHPA